jgi:hypothetical protein
MAPVNRLRSAAGPSPVFACHLDHRPSVLNCIFEECWIVHLWNLLSFCLLSKALQRGILTLLCCFWLASNVRVCVFFEECKVQCFWISPCLCLLFTVVPPVFPCYPTLHAAMHLSSGDAGNCWVSNLPSPILCILSFSSFIFSESQVSFQPFELLNISFSSHYFQTPS